MPPKRLLFRSEAPEKVLHGAAERTGDSAGDGTTTSTLLARAIDLKRELDRAARISIDVLRHE